MKLKLLSGLMIISLAGWVCAQPAKPAPETNAPIQVAAGKEFTITLKSNPTTGYRWQLAKPADEAVVKPGKNSYQADQHAPGMVGGGGKEVWTFTAVKPGKTVLEFKYARAWEKDKPPVRTANYEVEVTK